MFSLFLKRAIEAKNQTLQKWKWKAKDDTIASALMDLKNDKFKARAEKKENWQNSIIRNICITGVFAGLMCVLSPISIPVGAIPITLATLVLYLIGAIFNWKIASIIVLVYLLLGTMGLPVFSSFQGGFQVILGPTGGYLVGYLPCVLIESLLLSLWPNKKWLFPISMVLGTIVLYAIGTIWFMFYSNTDFIKAIMGCVIPFLAGDAIKIAIATILGIRLRPILEKRS